MKTRNYFPLHIDSGNRGCEAIALGTKEILQLNKDEYIGLSKKFENDRITGLADKVTLELARIPQNLSCSKRFIYKAAKMLHIVEHRRKQFEYEYIYEPFLRKTDSVTLITGGDMLCYDNNEVIYINEYLYQKGLPTVLWGCSFGKENYTDEKYSTLKKINLITARESLTYDYLKNILRLKNVYLFPDPAFVLTPEEIELPTYFGKDCVGINLSNFVNADVGFNTVFGKNILRLINYIVCETDYNIILIPHVFWNGQDDRVICGKVKEYFAGTGRVHLLCSEHLNYCQIRYVISKCRFFIGARTHSMISAYSMCVPSLALGYSIKSKGIAKDISMPDYTVLDYRNLKSETEITDRFRAIEQNEKEIRENLERTIPAYVHSAYGAKAVLEGVK